MHMNVCLYVLLYLTAGVVHFLMGNFSISFISLKKKKKYCIQITHIAVK